MRNALIFLLVEPSPILRSILHDWLDQAFAGHRTICYEMLTHFIANRVAENGVEALRLAAQERPSHILIEMELPEKTGFDVLRELRQILPDAAIVATGWYESRGVLSKVWSAGLNGFIRKHQLPSELLPLWNVLVEQK